MRSRNSLAPRFALVLCFAASLLLAGAQPTSAQNTTPDARWQAWIGCWEPIPADSAARSSVSQARVCVVPAAGTSAVEVVTVKGDSVLGRHTIDATGKQRDVSSEGCTGWERADWGSNGQRVYLRSSATCAGNVTRKTNGVFALSSAGEWIDVEGVVVGTGVGVRVTRYRDVTNSGALPREIEGALRGRTSGLYVARIGATAPLTTTDVVEASHFLDTGVLETFLVERHEGFDLDARKLVELDKAGVPSTVIDVMVALTYPRVFALDGSRVTGTTVSAEDAQEARRGRVIDLGTVYDPYGYGYYPYGYNPYGYGYGYGYGYPYSGWYFGNRPIIIVRQPSTDGTSESKHGQVVKGRGYTSGSGGSSSSTRPQSGSSGTSTKASSGGSSDRKSSGSGRTAKPRPPK